MRLADLKTGERAIVQRVLGTGAFRKRLVEMGFIRGKEIEVLLNAPLQDPVKYKILGYEISLRREEALQVEVSSITEDNKLENTEYTKNNDTLRKNLIETKTLKNEQQTIDEETQTFKEISIALIGNPNCGKTSLFNFASGAHERVGNYAGVTVDATEGYTKKDGYTFQLVDLPGTYSLSAYSPEELYVRQQITQKRPDIVVNVIDTSNLERNLYLTTQLMDMGLNIVCALNMYDEAEKRGDKLNITTLENLLGIRMIPTVFKAGRGVDELFKAVIDTYNNRRTNIKQVNHGKYIEDAISELNKNGINRYTAIKLLEYDKNIENTTKDTQILKLRNTLAESIKHDVGEDSETAIMNAKYGFINGALKEAEYKEGKGIDTYQMTHILDAIITNKYLGFPIFFLFLYLMFQATFTIGQYPMDWIEEGVGMLGEWISKTLPEGPIKDMIVDGIIGGVGSVVVFLPQILILYFFISIMEDSGYMARAAFIMDKLMHKMGLHGKSFIPLIMGFGCNVPAVMATRTIESMRNRLITMLILPLMSCSARLPIYVMITGTFFAMKYRSLIMISLYVIGIILAVIVSKIFNKFITKGEDPPFVMELPPYRFPTKKAIARHTWEKGKQYLKKMGGIILVASIIVWALGYFPHNDKLNTQEQKEQSYIGKIGKAMEPIFETQGFDWKLNVGLASGLFAKEVVASTMGVLYADDDSFSEDDSYSEDTVKYSRLHKQMERDGITPLTAYAFLLFILIYFPCVATIVAIKNESGSWKWAVFAAIYTTALAWIVSAVVYQIGSKWF